MAQNEEATSTAVPTQQSKLKVQSLENLVTKNFKTFLK